MEKEHKICRSYCGLACVDGSCPMANYDEYMERGYDIVHSCSECHYYRGCDDCYFADKPDYCEKCFEERYNFLMSRFMRCE